MVYPLSLQEDTIAETRYRPAFSEDSYDEINAELQMLAMIQVEEQETPKKVFVGSGDIHTWEFNHHG